MLLTVEHYEFVRDKFEYDPDSGLLYLTRLNRVIGTPNHDGYLRCGCYPLGAKMVHQLAWLWMTKTVAIEIDHINGIRSDNRWINLREATRALNNANSSRIRSNPAKGVTYHTGGYRASITINKKQHYLGWFRDLDSAKEAYAEAAVSAFGEYARF